MTDGLSEEIKLGADASGVEAGVGRAKRSLADLGSTAEQTTKKAGEGIGRLGDGGDKAARNVERATKSMQGQIQRLIASFEGGEKGSRKFYESLARQKGVDANALRPLLDQLDAVKAKSEAAADATSKVTGSLGTMSESARTATRFLGALGLAVSVGGLVAWARSALNAADETAKLAQKVGLATEQVAGLQLAFDQAGAGDQMQQALARLSKEAAAGSKAFESMGVSARGADGQLKSTRDLLAEVADKFSSYRDGIEKTALAQQLFGKAGADLIPLLNAGSGALDDYDAKAKRLGLTLDKETTQAAERFNDSMDLIAKRAQGAARQLATGLLPVLEQLSIIMAEAAQQGESFEEVGLNISTVLETIAVLAVNTNYVLKQTGDTLGGLIAGYQSFFTGNFEGAREIGRQMRENGETARREVDATTRAILNARKIAASVKGAEQYDEPRFRKALSSISSDKVDAPIVSTGRSGARGAASKAEAAANRELENQARLLAELSGLSGTFAKDWDLLTNAFNAGRLSLEGLTEAQAQLLAKQPFAVALAKEEAEAVKELAKAREADAKAYADALESRQSAAATIADQITKERESIEMMGLTRLELAELEAAKLEDAAASKVRLAAIADEIDWSGKMGDAYRAEAAHLRELANLKRSGAVREASVEAAADAAKAWEQTAGKIEDMLTDALMRGFESGKGFGENLADSIVNIFKTYVARAIAQAISRAIISAMAGTQWGALLNTVMGGGGGFGGNLGSSVSSLSSLYSAYSTAAGGGAGAAGAVGGSASAMGSWAGGSMSTGNAVGSMYANATGTGIDGLLSANGAYGTTAGGGSGWMAAAGYAALIVAAIAIANNLYSKGYTRAALGIGGPQEGSFYNTTFQTDPSLQRWGGNSGFEDQKRGVLEGIGLNEKWSDILSGTVRLAATFGRKLGAYGYEVAVGPDETAVGGYQHYKGGMFRSDKITRMDVDQRDAEMIRGQVEMVRESAKAMAAAMGMSQEAIDAYTGSLTINFKNATTAEEQSKRLGEAMEQLHFELLRAASGGQLTKETFKQMMEDVQKLVEQARISTQGMADIITDGMLGRMDQSQVGQALADMVLGGIYETIASPFAAQIAEAFQAQIITPVFTAILAGVPISQAISQQAIDSVVAKAQEAAMVLDAIFSDANFQQAMADIQTAIRGISVASTIPARNVRGLSSSLSGLGSTASRAKAEWKSLTDSIIDEIRRLRGEVLGETPAGLAYAQSQFAITTAQARSGDKDAAKALPGLSRNVETLLRLTSASGSDFVLGQADLMASLMETAQILAKKYKFKLPAFADGGSHAGGWAMVGERGPELAFMPPAKIYNASDTRQMMGGNDELLSEVRGLRSEVRAVVTHTAKSAKVLDRALAPESDAFQVREALA